jgi:hypothetical protein
MVIMSERRSGEDQSIDIDINLDVDQSSVSEEEVQRFLNELKSRRDLSADDGLDLEAIRTSDGAIDEEELRNRVFIR